MAMLTQFMTEWATESERWVDAFVKTAAAESPENKHLLSAWANDWTRRSIAALTPLAKMMYFEDAQDALEDARAQLQARITKTGLHVHA